MPSDAPDTTSPQATRLLLGLFAEAYRQEVTAEEDIFRTLPFFGTALGVVIAIVTFAAGHIPVQLAGQPSSLPALVGLLALFAAILQAVGSMAWLSLAIRRRKYNRIGSEAELLDRLAELRGYYDNQGIPRERQDDRLVPDMEAILLRSYESVTPRNRAINERRYRYRAQAASNLMRSLICALAAAILLTGNDLGNSVVSAAGPIVSSAMSEIGTLIRGAP